MTGIMIGVSLGFFFFKISYTLRDAMLVNGILTNAEVWNHLKTKHVEILESVDLKGGSAKMCFLISCVTYILASEQLIFKIIVPTTMINPLL